jgi:hypothetical protein
MKRNSVKRREAHDWSYTDDHLPKLLPLSSTSRTPSALQMPETITTLPPELIVKIFRSLDHVGTAVRLSKTCRLMHDVWLANDSKLSLELVPSHPAFWKDPNLKPSNKPIISLWDHAVEYENARQGRFSLSMRASLCAS